MSAKVFAALCGLFAGAGVAAMMLGIWGGDERWTRTGLVLLGISVVLGAMARDEIGGRR
jgi:hypothetical protein